MENVSVTFRLVKISTEQFAIIPEAYDKASNEIKLSVNVNFGLNSENRIIVSIVKVQFEQNAKPFLISEIANHYQLEEKSWEELNKNDKIIIPKNIAAHFLVLTIGTLRGVIHAKTENTGFVNFILPTINVADLLQNDVELLVS